MGQFKALLGNTAGTCPTGRQYLVWGIFRVFTTVICHIVFKIFVFLISISVVKQPWCCLETQIISLLLLMLLLLETVCSAEPSGLADAFVDSVKIGKIDLSPKTKVKLFYSMISQFCVLMSNHQFSKNIFFANY